MLGVSDSVADRVRLGVPEPAEWKRIGDEIHTVFIPAGK